MLGYPKVSVVIPTYGRADLLIKTVNSVLQQTYDNIEIVVVDDNGKNTPNQLATESKLQTISDKRLKYVPLDLNHGGSFARNVGARSSSGEYICFLDDDDEFEPTKIEKQIKLLCIDESLVACYCNHRRKNHITGQDTVYENDKSGNLLLDVLLFRIDVCSGSTLMVRRHIFDQLNGFTETLSRFQDYEFLTRLCALGKIGLVAEPLVIINTHQGSYRNKTFRREEADRKKYLQIIRPQIDCLSPKDKKAVQFANNTYLFVSAVKLRSLRGVVKYSLKCGLNVRFLKFVFGKAKKMIFKH